MLTCHSLETETSELPYECWRQVIDFILAPEYIFLGTAFNHVNNKTGQTKPDCVLGSESLKQNKIWVSFQSHQASDKNLWLNTRLGVSSIYNSNSDRWGSLALSNSPHSCTVITNSPGLASQAGQESQGEHDFIPSGPWHLPSFCFILQCESAHALVFSPTFLPSYVTYVS